jgi:hypothetical protein
VAAEETGNKTLLLGCFYEKVFRVSGEKEKQFGDEKR